MSFISINLSRIIYLGLCLVFSINVSADNNRPFDKGLLWVISHPEQKDSYLFGTMHSAE